VFLGQRSLLPASTLFYVATLILLPLLTIGPATAISQRWGGCLESSRSVATRFAFAFIPLGFAMWLAHYSFHLLTGYDAVVPVVQRFANDWSLASPSEPEWLYACCRKVQKWLVRMEILSLDLGLLASLYLGYRLSLDSASRPMRAFAPWALLMVLLFAVGVWTVLQPMEMRGTLPAGG